ncbi:MAG TPA: Fe-S protein assembly co-chaperone HscB, partial [Candidatus Binataceae bacterium]|nr:Fe-S protein assembly co-chaperone HscB [Candidatus Binataceae bacterium]
MSDYFEAFGIERTLALDPKDLETRFYALSRKLHPDLFARRSKPERDQAEEDTAQLNDAYRTLRDPVSRAEYLLKLEGFDIGEQGSKDVPPELLEEMFELNLALEEMLESMPDGGGGYVNGPWVDMSEKLAKVDEELQVRFAEWDSGRRRETLSAIRG